MKSRDISATALRVARVGESDGNRPLGHETHFATI
jgi:hypothetical protein